jgi:hypothetical protein
MAYIGTKPTIGNFQICDAISVVNGQAAYTMQVGGVNVSPQSASHMIVSLNGTIQKPNSSFTVSGSTITFASNLATGDVIDFIQILGDVLDLGVPSDDTVTAAKIGANAVTAAKLNNDIISGSTELASEPADTDEFLVSDAGTLKRIDYSLIKGGGKVLQAVSYNKTSSVIFSSGNSGLLHTGNNITPSSSSSKILVLAMNFNEASGTITNYAETRLYRDSSALLTVNNAMQYQETVGTRQQFGVSYLDNPATTSTLSYSLYHNNISGTSRNYTYYATYYTLLEIGA